MAISTAMRFVLKLVAFIVTTCVFIALGLFNNAFEYPVDMASNVRMHSEYKIRKSG